MRQLFYTSCYSLALPVWLLVGMGTCYSQQAIAYAQQEVPDTSQDPGKTMLLREALKLLEGHYGVDIVFGDRIIQNFSVSQSHLVLSGSLEENLNRILKPTGLKYKKIGNNSYAVLAKSNRRKPVLEEAKNAPKIVLPDIQIITPPSPLEDLVATIVERKISGLVKDEKGEPLPGVNILVKGSQQGVISDSNGKFSIEAPDENAVLVFSFVGYVSEELVVGNRISIDISLKVDEKALEEVVVVGYGTQRKSDITGSVSQISSEKFENVPASNALQLLQGRLPGLSITPNSGQPGAGNSVLIRGVQSINGSNSPIYVIDGAIYENIDNINPQDIETFTILKDASAAAIYGSRAANGVILISTKRGDATRLPTFTFKKEQGLQNEGNLRLGFLNADQWIELATEAWENSGKSVPWTSDQLSQLRGVDVDWQGASKRTGTWTNNNLSLTGGSKNSNYYMSLNYLLNKGIIKNQDFSRINLRLNADHKIGDRITVGNSINIYSARQRTQRDYDYLNAYSASFRYTPLNPMREADGDFGVVRNANLQGKTPSPLWVLNNSEISNTTKGIDGNVYLSIDVLKGLKFTARGSFDWKQDYNSNFIGAMNPKYNMEGSNVNQVRKEARQTVHMIGDFLVDYQKTFSKHHAVNVLFGYSLEDEKFENLMASRGRTPNNSIRYLTAGDPNTAQNDNTFSDWAFTSLFSRVNYSFKEKYMLSTTVRRDGSSRLAEGNRFGTFPSVSVAWRLGAEEFLAKYSFLDELKIRSSWGKVGNVLGLNAYGTAVSLSQWNYIMNQQAVLGYTFAEAVNTDLKWESTGKLNLGADVSLFRNSLYLIADYFIEDTRDLLFPQPIPLSVGLVGSPFINAGHVRNKGIEFEIGHRKKMTNWSYDLGFNFSHVKNEVIDLEGRDLRTSGIQEGYPIGTFFGYRANGIIRTQQDLDNHPHYRGKGIGDIWLLDIDGYDPNGKLTGKPDGKVDAADRTLFGKVRPDFSYGLFGAISYKNFSFQVQLQGVAGIEKNLRSGDSPILDLFSSVPNAEADYILDRFHPQKNPNGSYPRVSVSDTGQNTLLSDFWLVNSSYLSFRNVNISYNLSNKWLTPIKVRGLSVYYSVQNLFTIGNDYAEISSAWTVPIPRTQALGLRISL